MAEFDPPKPKDIPAQLRLLLLAIALGTAALLALAWCLKPSPYQHGTHQQLGLPPCSFEVLFGIPCPTCGMTTAWVHLVHGELLSAFRASSGGTLLAGLAIVAIPWLMISALGGRWLGWKPNGKALACISTLIIVIMLVQWGFRLFSN